MMVYDAVKEWWKLQQAAYLWVLHWAIDRSVGSDLKWHFLLLLEELGRVSSIDSQWKDAVKPFVRLFFFNMRSLQQWRQDQLYSCHFCWRRLSCSRSLHSLQLSPHTNSAMWLLLWSHTHFAPVASDLSNTTFPVADKDFSSWHRR